MKRPQRSLSVALLSGVAPGAWGVGALVGLGFGSNGEWVSPRHSMSGPYRVIACMVTHLHDANGPLLLVRWEPEPTATPEHVVGAWAAQVVNDDVWEGD